MTSFPRYQGDPQGCQYERVDEPPKGEPPSPFMCNNPAIYIWHVGDVNVLLCSSCANWLKTLESLGLKS